MRTAQGVNGLGSLGVSQERMPAHMQPARPVCGLVWCVPVHICAARAQKCPLPTWGDRDDTQTGCMCSIVLHCPDVDAGVPSGIEDLFGSRVMPHAAPQAHGEPKPGNGHGAIQAGTTAAPGDGMCQHVTAFVWPGVDFCVVGNDCRARLPPNLIKFGVQQDRIYFQQAVCSIL